MASSTPEAATLEYTPTWVVALVCCVIVIISLCVERFLHYLGKFLKHNQQPALFEALQKLKEELMLLGFISLLLTVFQGLISNICITASVSYHMLPCEREEASAMGRKHNGKHFSEGLAKYQNRHLTEGAGSGQCLRQGKVPLLSTEALHDLHIFIFVLAVVHVLFCAMTMVLGGMKIQRWKHWEDTIRKENTKQEKIKLPRHTHHREFFMTRAMGYWRQTVVVGWIISFFKQFHASVTKSDYIALRSGFIMKHCRTNPNFDFHKYMMRTLEADFKKVVGISWYLWLFVVIFLLLNVDGWHTYFWLSFLPLVLLLAVGAKLEHIITRLAQEAAVQITDDVAPSVKPSDDHFWFRQPGIVLYLIHFILFQNSFEIAFFFWILWTYGFGSCIMEKVGYIIPRLVIGVVIQVLCSYSTLPLYAIVTQMGEMFKQHIFAEQMQEALQNWALGAKERKKPVSVFSSIFRSSGRRAKEIDVANGGPQEQRMVSEAAQSVRRTFDLEEIIASAGEMSFSRRPA